MSHNPFHIKKYKLTQLNMNLYFSTRQKSKLALVVYNHLIHDSVALRTHRSNQSPGSI